MHDYKAKLTIFVSIIATMLLGIGFHLVISWFGYASNITIAWILTSLSIIPIPVVLLVSLCREDLYLGPEELHPLLFLSAIMLSTTSLTTIKLTTNSGAYPILFSVSILSLIFSVAFFINNAYAPLMERMAKA